MEADRTPTLGLDYIGLSSFGIALKLEEGFLLLEQFLINFNEHNILP